jgi:shikimate 5-dehydrogenase
MPELRLVNHAETAVDSPSLLHAAREAADRHRLLGRAFRLADGATLLVNTTSLGMKGSRSTSISKLPRSAVVYDIVYVPLGKRSLLARARAATLRRRVRHVAAPGRPGFRAWFGGRSRSAPSAMVAAILA